MIYSVPGSRKNERKSHCGSVWKKEWYAEAGASSRTLGKLKGTPEKAGISAECEEEQGRILERE